MFNTGLFVLEVQKRPCLWNTKDSGHNNRQMKFRAFEEIVEVFKKCDSYSHQNITVDVLQRKWKHLRDYYVREKKRMPFKDSGAKHFLKRKRYSPLLEMLQFLNANQGTDTEEINIERNEIEENCDVEANEEEASGNENSQFAPYEIETICIEQSNPLVNDNEESADEQFLSSLMPIIKNMNLRERLKFRAQLMNRASAECSNTDEDEKTETPVPCKRKKLENIEDNKETKCAEALPRRDEFSIFGEYVANKLRNIRNAHARHTAEFHINGILYKAGMGEYDKGPKEVRYKKSKSRSNESSNVTNMEFLTYEEGDSNDIEDVVKTEVID